MHARLRKWLIASTNYKQSIKPRRGRAGNGRGFGASEASANIVAHRFSENGARVRLPAGFCSVGSGDASRAAGGAWLSRNRSFNFREETASATGRHRSRRVAARMKSSRTAARSATSASGPPGRGAPGGGPPGADAVSAVGNAEHLGPPPGDAGRQPISGEHEVLRQPLAERNEAAAAVGRPPPRSPATARPQLHDRIRLAVRSTSAGAAAGAEWEGATNPTDTGERRTARRPRGGWNPWRSSTSPPAASQN